MYHSFLYWKCQLIVIFSLWLNNCKAFINSWTGIHRQLAAMHTHHINLTDCGRETEIFVQGLIWSISDPTSWIISFPFCQLHSWETQVRNLMGLQGWVVAAFVSCSHQWCRTDPGMLKGCYIGKVSPPKHGPVEVSCAVFTQEERSGCVWDWGVWKWP